MRKLQKYTISKESYEDMLKAGRFNPCLEITFRDKTGQHTHKLSAGADDDLDVYREGQETYILSRNSRMDYMGLEIFSGADKVGDVFLTSYQIQSVFIETKLPPFAHH